MQLNDPVSSILQRKRGEIWTRLRRETAPRRYYSKRPIQRDKFVAYLPAIDGHRRRSASSWTSRRQKITAFERLAS